jgi:hypothetical protein
MLMTVTGFLGRAAVKNINVAMARVWALWPLLYLLTQEVYNVRLDAKITEQCGCL